MKHTRPSFNHHIPSKKRTYLKFIQVQSFAKRSLLYIQP